MRQLLITLTFGIVFCLQLPKSEKSNVSGQKIARNKLSILNGAGEKIQGDFRGDGRRGFASGVKITEGQGNPVEGGTADAYEIQFSDRRLKPIKVGCCSVRLINEGDLNNDGTDEISVFQAPMNGCTYSMSTYSFRNGAWKKVVETFLIPTGCQSITDRDLQQRVFLENGIIYYYDSDVNKNGKLIRKKVAANSLRKVN